MTDHDLPRLRADAARKAAALAEANELIARKLQERLAELPAELGLDWGEIAAHAAAQDRALTETLVACDATDDPALDHQRLASAPKPAVKSANKPAKPAVKAPSKNNSKGKRLSGFVKDKIEYALKRGEKGSHVAREFGVSYPTIHKIKQGLGLVNARK